MKSALPIRNANKGLALWLMTVLILFGLGTVKIPDPAGSANTGSANTFVKNALIPSRLPQAILRFTPLRGLEAYETSGTYCADLVATLQMTADSEKDSRPASERAVENPFHAIIVDAASRYDVDSAMVKAIIQAESGYNPKAVSHRGAMGLMQLMPITAKEMGLEDSFDPKQNIHAGVRYFKRLLVRYNGDVRLALAAYNAGMGKVKKYRGIPPFKATRHYIKKVLKYHQYYAATEGNAKKPPPVLSGS